MVTKKLITGHVSLFANPLFAKKWQGTVFGQLFLEKKIFLSNFFSLQNIKVNYNIYSRRDQTDKQVNIWKWVLHSKNVFYSNQNSDHNDKRTKYRRYTELLWTDMYALIQSDKKASFHPNWNWNFLIWRKDSTTEVQIRSFIHNLSPFLIHFLS